MHTLVITLLIVLGALVLLGAAAFAWIAWTMAMLDHVMDETAGGEIRGRTLEYYRNDERASVTAETRSTSRIADSAATTNSKQSARG